MTKSVKTRFCRIESLMSGLSGVVTDWVAHGPKAVAELMDSVRYCLEELGRLDSLRDENRLLKEKLEGMEFSIRSLKDDIQAMMLKEMAEKNRRV